LKERVFIITTDDKIVSLTNTSDDENSFKVSAEELHKYIDKIKAIVHTHKSECTPSNEDVLGMYAWRIPWLIVSNNCIKAYLFKGTSILELDVNSLIPKELNDFLMQVLK
jgi:proteasome lid subunit RPN8/RPN11